ncbi:MAG TPA: hypothetical protein VI791_01445 [Patescibacteria group bacterium]|nr:hypothetical protein [Patescibacteria group bacterium]
MMIRTQVYLPQTDINYLKELSRMNKSTMSNELRKVIKIAKSKLIDKNEDYPQRLLKVKGNWFKPGEWEEIRNEFEERMSKFE